MTPKPVHRARGPGQRPARPSPLASRGPAAAVFAVAPHPPAPPLARDPWAWASALAIVPLLARCAGAPLGEAVAEDFDFLRRTLLTGMGSLLDGGGSTAFWRPVAHQLYYAVLGPLILTHPRLVAALHAVLLAASTLLVYRALRRSLGGVPACVAATFPLLAESTRTLVSWPSQFVDVGLYFFSALALHEVSRRRLPTALAATLAALLCKEVAVVTALLSPWLPGVLTPRERTRWSLAFGTLLVVWGSAYLLVRHTAHLTLPHGIEQDASLLATPLSQRFAWALGGSLRAAASLTLRPGPHDAAALALGVVLLACVVLAPAVLRAARARLAAGRAWVVWGLVWFAASTAALTPIFPLWQPNRSHFGSAGLGLAATVGLEAVHPALTSALVLGRFAFLMLAPAAAATIADEPPRTGAFMDFAQLSRLQRFMSATRQSLHADYPVAPRHTNVVEMNLPHGLIYALGGDHAVQVWYRDTTLHMVDFARLTRDSTLAMVAGVQFQPRAPVQIVLLSPEAMRVQSVAYRHLRDQRWAASVVAVDRADSLVPDTLHRVFHGNNAGYRAFAWLQMGRIEDAERESRRALALEALDPNGWRTLASALALEGRWDEALLEAERAPHIDFNDRSMQTLRERILAARKAAPAP